MALKWFFSVLLITLVNDQPKLVKTKLENGITISVPEGWKPMDALDFTERYPSVRAPIAAYTDTERTTDFSVNVSATQWPDANLELAQRFFKASIMNMFDRVEILKEGIHEVNGKKFIYFEFESRVNGTRVKDVQLNSVARYNFIQYLVEPKRTLVFSFSCPNRERENWQATANAMMKAIKTK